ncbi:hypothetical protein BWGOE4_44980 [Bacillus mycoides]|uniref:hypothetical protein n=1 Tax=Bacillus mycoides TaxID=1405 RepID=UPI00027995BF|nr:hypothetical protein [Bacillus mycoides]EJS07472.1 hypothetical protein IKM_01072 [Bacillus mycoides]OFD54009.1 hypothetical protein BWGOE4_44980 [Bacillus mycoides]OFD60483.1 hypothetical protein BWGOE7_45150 [Bacillus mycoides]OFD90723.1 hypothetical protein BWGOE12_45220 [Bacillus mycoides]
MFLGYVEIPKHETRYLDLSEEKKAELMRKKRRKKSDSDEGSEEAENKTLNRQKLHNRAKKNKKDSIEISFNGGADLGTWDYEANNYKN